MMDIWEEEEVHQNDQTYDNVTFQRHGQPKGRIAMKREIEKKSKESRRGGG
jgi:hypothetical protein